MGKHLAPKSKHELNFIKKTARAPEKRAEARPRKIGKPLELKLPRIPLPDKLPELRVKPWLFPALAILALIVIRFLPLEGWMIPAAYAIPALLAAAEFVADAYGKCRNGDYLNRELIVCLAALLLFVTGVYSVATLLLVFSRLASVVEQSFSERSVSAAAAALDILSKDAARVTEEGIERVDPETVEPGDILQVSAGEQIPLDGIIVDGITTVDTAAISGQRSPWAVNVGYRVYSGCRNLTSDIKIKVTRPYAQSTAKRLSRIVDGASGFPSEQESLAARYRQYDTPVVLGLALLIGVALPLFRGEWLLHLRRAAVLLIASSPVTECFSIPLLYRKALRIAGGFGMFSKGADCLEATAKADTVIFDKTGSITEGRYTVTDVCPEKMSEQQLLTLAATAESFSRHPIAGAIRDTAGKIDERVLKNVRLREFPGRGVGAYVGNKRIFAGNAALLEEHGIRYNIPSRPGTAVHVAVDNRYCGYILVSDKVRKRAFDALEGLRINGIKKLVLLTGDVISVARPIASRLNFDMLRAELKPEDKSKAVGYLMKNKGGHSTIGFVGDGENSGRIMSGADVGISMGSLGSDVAFACADIMMMDRDILKLPRLVSLSHKVYSAAWMNFAVGAGIDLLIILFGALGLLPPLAALIIRFATGVALLGNTLRIK